jgi:hypothetical protein
MSPLSPRSGQTAAEPPKAPNEDPGRLTEKVGVVIGIVTGVLGVLLAVGFALLPTSTGLEKICVVLASLALSVAVVSGIGAWRSGRRFATTVASAGLATICLASLSVAAQGGSSAQAPRNGLPTSQPLAGLAVNASNSTFQSGSQTVNERSYQQTLYDAWRDYNCASSASPSGITYSLNYKYRHFRATVGVADTSPAGMMDFSLLVDGQQKNVGQDLSGGQTETINVNVTRASRITLQDACTSSASRAGSYVTAVWINPVVTP